MKCSHCKRNNAILNLKYSGALCKKCFLRLIEARVRKYARLNKIFKKNDRILTIDPLSNFLVKKIIHRLPVKIHNKSVKLDNLEKIKDYTKKNKINKIIIPWTIDDECCYFLERLFLNKDKKRSKYISLLQVMTDEEALLFAKFNKINFSPNKKNKEIKHIIDSMQKKYPETKFSFVKSIEEMEKVLCFRH